MKYSTLYCFIFLMHFSTSWCKHLHHLAATHNVDQENPNAVKENSAKTEVSKKHKASRKLVYPEPDFVFEKTNLGNSYGNTTLFYDIVTHVVDSGYMALHILYHEIQEIEQKNEKNTGDNVFEEYFIHMNGIYEYYKKQMVKSELEREFYILEFIVKTNELLEIQCSSLLDKCLSINSSKDIKVNSEHRNDSIDRVTRYSAKLVKDVKKGNFAFICQLVNICRPFPSYSDYAAKILSEISSLPDKQFKSFIMSLNDIIILKAEFIKLFMEQEISTQIIMNLNNLQHDLNEARKLVNFLRHIINRRHTIFRSQDGSIKVTKKAMRILIDMFDKSFEILTEESIREDSNDVINSLKVWKDELGSFDIQTTLMNFLIKIENILTPFMRVPKIRNEVRTLIDFLVKGSSKYFAMVDEDLFNKGSKFVNSVNPTMEYRNSDTLLEDKLQQIDYY